MIDHSWWQVFMYELCNLVSEKCFYDPTWLQELLD